MFFQALDRTFYARASGRCGPPGEVLRRIAEEQGGQPDRPALIRAVIARIDAVERDVRLRPEAVPVLSAIRTLGLRTAVVSDCWYELPAFFSRLAVAPLLDARAFSYTVGHCKPHPRIYQAACGLLSVPPARCLYIGDGGSRELSGARRLGMTVVRLAAEDLGSHLTFDAEREWDGACVGDLTQLLPHLV